MCTGPQGCQLESQKLKNVFRANFIHYDGERDDANGKILSYSTNVKDNDHSFINQVLTKHLLCLPLYAWPKGKPRFSMQERTDSLLVKTHSVNVLTYETPTNIPYRFCLYF